jgi:hypothetical protein
LPLLDAVLSFDADFFVEGHTDTVMTRAELEGLIGKMRAAARWVDQFGADEQTVLAQAGQPLDEDTSFFVRAFIAGHRLESDSSGE